MEIMDIVDTSDKYVIGYISQKEMKKTDNLDTKQELHHLTGNTFTFINTGAKTCNYFTSTRKRYFSNNNNMCGTTIDIKTIINMPKSLEMSLGLNIDFQHGLIEKKPLGAIGFLSPEDDEDGTKFWIKCYKDKKEACCAS